MAPDRHTMSKSETVRARVDSSVKDDAAQVLKSMGLSLSDGIRMFLLRLAADKEFPFDIQHLSTPAPAKTVRD